MIYLSEDDIKTLPFTWDETVKVITNSVDSIRSNDFVQPVKKYLRYIDLKNRIIAMPAYIGGSTLRSGLKWIASFPDNITKGISRAHSVIILNQYDNGVPICIINSGSISSIRTASVSGFMIQHFLKHRPLDKVKVGMTGLGPIGQYHLSMCHDILQDKLTELKVYDLKKIDLSNLPEDLRAKITIADSWEDAYSDADIFMTCTVAKSRYIDKKPKPGSLHLNVSLRDYMPAVFPWFKGAMIVDSWEEVCRENTDIERFHLEHGLEKQGVNYMPDFLTGDFLNSLPADQAVMFNPMGMAVFDISVADYFFKLAEQHQKGVMLD